MKTDVNLKKELNCGLDEAIQRVTEALKGEGFGILTRIDFHAKIKEKLNQDIEPTVILGACNPRLALEAFRSAPDVTSLLPCNAVVRQSGPGRVSVELAKPTALMRILGDDHLVQLARDADASLGRALEKV